MSIETLMTRSPPQPSRPLFLRKADSDVGYEGQAATVSWIEELAARQFGQYPNRIVTLGRSTFHELFRIELAHGKRFVLKIARHAGVAETLRLEHVLYTECIPKSVTGIEVLAAQLAETRNWLALTEAAGVCLRDLDLDSEEFPFLIEALGRRMATYHACPRIDGQGYGLIERVSQNAKLVGSHAAWREFVCERLDEHLEIALERGVLLPHERVQIGSLFEEHAWLFENPRRIVLLHGDLGSHNVFVNPREREITALIDWEDALLGDPTYDLAMVASFYRMTEFLTELLAGYFGGLRSENVEERLGDLNFWLLYLRIVIAKAVSRARLGQDPVGDSPSKPKIRLALENIAELI